jgi:hypothetical protein
MCRMMIGKDHEHFSEGIFLELDDKNEVHGIG